MAEQENIDNFFKQKFEGYSVPPPEGLWNNISNIISAQQSNRKVIVGWRWLWAAAVLLPMTLGISVYLNNTNTNENTQSIAPSKTIVINSNPEIKTIDKNVKLNESQSITSIASKTKSNPAHTTTTHQQHNNQNVKSINNQYNNSQHSDNNFLSVLKSKSAHIKSISIKNPKLKTLKSNSIAQNYLPINKPIEEPSRDSRITLSGLVLPSYSYRTVNSQAINNSLPDEKGINTITGGIAINYAHSTRWSIETGAYISQAGQSIAMNMPASVNPLSRINKTFGAATQNQVSLSTNSLGAISYKNNVSENQYIPNSKNSDFSAAMTSPIDFQNTTSDVTIKQLLSYIEIPLVLRYNLMQNPFKLSLATGISSNILTNNQAILTQEGQSNTIGETENIKPLSFSTRLGIGIDYPIFSNFYFHLEPTVKYFINPINSDNTNQFKPYSFGVYTGIAYSF